MRTRCKAYWNAFWRDKHGKVVLGQLPNVPLVGWLVFLFAAKIWPHLGVLAFLSTAFLFVWAYLELTSGVTYARRTLGAFVLLYIIVSHS